MSNGVIDRDQFLQMSPEEQAVEVGKRLPSFATKPKAEQQEALAQLRQRLQAKKPEEISPSQFVAEGAKRRAGDIAAMIGATVAPGKGLLGFGSRLLGAEAGEDIGQAATGQKVTPGFGAASQLVGEGVAKAVAPLVSPATYRAFANRTVKALASKLDDMVPSWRDFPATAKGLYERAHGTGQRILSQDFETAMQAIKRQVPETLVVQVPEVIEVAGRLDQIAKPRNARALIDELPALRKAGGKPYRAALKALSDELPEGLSPELDAARAVYRNGAGFIEFAEKGKFLYGERFDPAKAQAALDRFGKSLIGRGMDEIRAIIRGPGEKPIEPVKHTPWVQRLEGTLVGAAAGTPFGIPHAVGGAAGGLAASTMLPRTSYRNVPLTPAAKWAGRLAPVAVGEGAREAARQLNVPEGVYGP